MSECNKCSVVRELTEAIRILRSPRWINLSKTPLPEPKPDEVVDSIIKEIFYDALDVGESSNGATITDTGVSGYKDKLLAWAKDANK